MNRRDDEQPAATARWGWRFHHVGVPTERIMPGERHIDAFGLHVSGFASSPYGIEWMRYDPDSPIDDLIKSVPHVAFEVDDLETALVGKSVLTPPNSPSAGVVVAMIVDNGCPIELIQFSRKG